MVIKSYKKYVLGLLLLAPVSICADFSDDVYNFTKDVGQGVIGWSTHAGLGYLAYRSYGALNSHYIGPVNMQSIGGYTLAPDDLITLSATALGAAAVYHSAMFWQFCTFGVQLRKMKRQNTSTNPALRNRWANCDSAADLMEQIGNYQGGREALKKQLLLDMGLEQNTAPLEAIKKIDDALTQLDKRLKMYASYTNIVEITAQRMIDADSDAQALLYGDVLINRDLTLYMNDILNDYASNSWISNSLTIGWYFKEECYLKRPWLYTATYNMASHCAMKTLEQYARLKAVRHILQQYIPENQRQPRVIVHQH